VNEEDSERDREEEEGGRGGGSVATRGCCAQVLTPWEHLLSYGNTSSLMGTPPLFHYTGFCECI